MSEPSQALMDWVAQVVAAQVPQLQHSQPMHWQKLSGDAGFRQYFRLNTTPGTLAVLAPPETEDNPAFVKIAEFLRQGGLRTPAIIAQDLERGFLLVEDLGHTLLLDHLSADKVEVLYGEVLMELLRLQQLPWQADIFPAYTAAKLRTELEVFNQWFVGQLLDKPLNAAEVAMLDELYSHLEQSALAQPQVIVHRDFHSRNLIYEAGVAPGIIDFQDAVIGPVTYDLVSLLRDCYIQWPADSVDRWALAYASMAQDVGLLRDLNPQQFLQQFDWMGLQRHIKVLGVFARLSLRDGKHNYLRDLPLVVHYVRSISARYSQTQAFAEWFDAALLPLAQQQDWYAPVAKL